MMRGEANNNFFFCSESSVMISLELPFVTMNSGPEFSQWLTIPKDPEFLMTRLCNILMDQIFNPFRFYSYANL